MKLAIFVFSFNRGEFLRHCIDSLESCIPGQPIFIMDDDSTDKTTQTILTGLETKYPIHYQNKEVQKEHKTGGLYSHMNRAMAIALQEDYKFVLFIQDDMQMVRPFSQRDMTLTKRFFEKNTNSIQLNTTFHKKENNSYERYTIDSSQSAYIVRKDLETGKSNFSAVGIFHVARFFEYFKTFKIGEFNNSQYARDKGLVLGRTIYPFMCWLPYPPSFRGKKRSSKHALFEYLANAGFYPIEIMNDEEIDTFLNRDHSILPIMDDFLRSPSSPRQNVWAAGGGEYIFLAAGGPIASLYRGLSKVKKMIARLFRFGNSKHSE